jgi:hypothetical protein
VRLVGFRVVILKGSEVSELLCAVIEMSPTELLKAEPLLLTITVLPLGDILTFSEPAVTPQIVPLPPEEVKVIAVA